MLTIYSKLSQQHCSDPAIIASQALEALRTALDRLETSDEPAMTAERARLETLRSALADAVIVSPPPDGFLD